ncbi:MAG: hypothetical protein ABII74_02670 [Elusimicrobiota bacterium]
MENNIHQKLFLIAKGFFRLEPWQFLGNDDIFGLFLKDKDELYFVSVMGDGGEEYGALFMKGWIGYQTISDGLNDTVDGETMINSCNLLSVSLCSKEGLAPDLLRYHKRYNLDLNFLPQFPAFMVKKPQEIFKPPKDREAESLCLCIQAIIELFQKNLIQPETFLQDDQIKIFEISSQNGDLQIISKYEKILRPETVSESQKTDEETLNQLKKLRRLPTVYNISAPAGLFVVKDKVTRTFLVHEDKQDFILAGNALYEEELKEEALNILIKIFLGKNSIQQKGLPEEIRTDSKLLFDLLNQTLTALNVKMTYLEHLPKIKAIIKEMQELGSKI